MRKRTAVLVAASGVVLAGCGGDDDSDNGVIELEPDEILAEAEEAVDAAESVHIVGTGMIQDGGFDMDLTVGADGGTGTIGIGDSEFELLRVEDDFYMRANAQSWEFLLGSGDGAFADMAASADTLADQYVLVPSGDPPFSDAAQFLERGTVTSQMFTADGEITKGEESEVDGQPVIALEAEGGGTLYIATTGEPLPVRITAAEGEDGSMDFEWDVEVDVAAPGEADIVDLAELRQ